MFWGVFRYTLFLLWLFHLQQASQINYISRCLSTHRLHPQLLCVTSVLYQDHLKMFASIITHHHLQPKLPSFNLHFSILKDIISTLWLWASVYVQDWATNNKKAPICLTEKKIYRLFKILKDQKHTLHKYVDVNARAVHKIP